MKKELLIASLFAAAVASAGSLTTSNAMGYVPITSSSAKGENMFLVTPPFSGYSGDNVSVAEVIQTANLAENDELFIPKTEGTGYNHYRLNSSKVWVASKTVTITGGVVVEESGDSPEVATVPRGSGFFVKTGAAQVNLFGNAVTTATAVSVPQGWKLIGSTVPTSSTAITSFSAAGAGDMILLADGTKYLKQADGWKKYNKASSPHWLAVEDSETIPAGVAFWYKSVSGASITF